MSGLQFVGSCDPSWSVAVRLALLTVSETAPDSYAHLLSSPGSVGCFVHFFFPLHLTYLPVNFTPLYLFD